MVTAMAFLAIFDLLWWGVGYVIARVVLPLVSFGKVRVGPVGSIGFNWLGCRRNGVGVLEIAPMFAALIGLLVFCSGFVMALYFFH
jgi:hypothetical protein